MNDSVSNSAASPAATLTTLRRVARILQSGAPLPATLRIRYPEIASLAGSKFAARKDALNAIAVAFEFPSWTVLKQSLEAIDGGLHLEKSDFVASFLLNWFRDHASAVEVHRETGGYLFGFRTQCVITQGKFVEVLGLDPNSPDWERIGHDTLSNRDPIALARLQLQITAGREAREKLRKAKEAASATRSLQA